MKRFFYLCLALMLFSGRATAVQAWPSDSETTTAVPQACDADGTQTSGAIYRICMPTLPWNGDLVVYAHGYVSPTEPVGIPEDQLSIPGGASIPDTVTLLGYAFATTSYSVNGLAVQPGIADLVDLVSIFTTQKGAPNKVYLVGVSEGGVMTALAIEQYANVFDGGLAMCGPYGDFAAQINYWGDFRVLFDYFLPGLMPGDATHIPQTLIDDWDNYYQTVILPAITDPANAHAIDQLLAVSGAPYDPVDSNTKTATIERLLWYNVFGTNDGRSKLGGQPFDNSTKVYVGSDDDVALNANVARYTAEATAVAELNTHYQTSGVLTAPLVTLHTTGDPVVPYWHAPQYTAKTIFADNIALHSHMSAERYGHCAFTSNEVLTAFAQIINMVNNPPAYQPTRRAFIPLVQK